ncbi:putative ammonia monooxygenase [Azorhizobium caulinodans ORS 571]|uniref:Putative ammonia monooxygenase n=1 Tax=Azorhizobium caulinodans (strain ATCC 43989 / DSM 5975 / JCM 20966 / LMG 6465 / NBRC 14845 / NCIMB 13405 / ORS 571) TaxID=438753 RepID=A8IB98_AZOC5|nr:AbrB family transcriptional regulator [Azorhizobium caulinodans]BAF88629.1 putative ammonia monooxygenase [Azorhizobium caulinodans ORS 571]
MKPSPSFNRASLGRVALGLAIGLVGGCLFAWIRTPLPWIIGPIICCGFATFLGLPLKASSEGRIVGMLVLGVALGLYFTPEAAIAVLAHLPVIIAASGTTLVVGAAASFLLARTARIDHVTAFFCSVPGGVAEMSMVGERFGGRPMPIAVTQLLRVVSVTILIPTTLTLLGAGGSSTSALGALPFSPTGLAVSLCLAFAFSALLARFRFRNAWLLGPMAVGCVLGLSEAGLSSVPPWLTAVGQVLMGAHIGAQFDRALITSMWRFIPAALINLGVLMAGCAGVGVLVAYVSGISPGNMVLATSPGGVTEMCITAKVLHLDVPIVVAFHIVRIFLVILSAPYLFRLLRATGVMPMPPTHAAARLPAE